MNVNKTRCKDKAVCIDYTRSTGVESRGDRADLPVADCDIDALS